MKSIGFTAIKREVLIAGLLRELKALSAPPAAFSRRFHPHNRGSQKVPVQVT